MSLRRCVLLTRQLWAFERSTWGEHSEAFKELATESMKHGSLIVGTGCGTAGSAYGLRQSLWFQQVWCPAGQPGPLAFTTMTDSGTDKRVLVLHKKRDDSDTQEERAVRR